MGKNSNKWVLGNSQLIHCDRMLFLSSSVSHDRFPAEWGVPVHPCKKPFVKVSRGRRFGRSYRRVLNEAFSLEDGASRR